MDETAIAAAETQLPAKFDYAEVPDNLRQALRDDTTTMHGLTANEHIIRVQKGSILNKWKNALPFGQFMGWVAAEFDMNHQTALNYMDTATYFGDLPGNVAVMIKGIYFLASDDVEQARRDLAIEMATHGKNVSKSLAYVIANAPDWLLRLTLDGEVAAKEAHNLVITLKLAAPVVQRDCEKWKVKHAAAVDFLSAVLTAHQNGDDRNPVTNETLLEEIRRAEGWLIATDFEVHIADASKDALEAFLSERSRAIVAHRIEATYWSKRVSGVTFVSLTQGRLVLDNIGAELQLPTDIRPGDMVEIELRVKRKKPEQSS